MDAEQVGTTHLGGTMHESRASSALRNVAIGLIALLVASTLYACADNDIKSSSAIASGASSASGEKGAKSEDFEATAADFVSLKAMTPVSGYFIANKLGKLDEAVAVAKNPDGGVYPVGTIIQLVPQEAMVKRAKGWSAATNDWEFFFLDVTADGATIVTRGAEKTVNRFGGNCASCHALAEPKFDFVCEQTHGCDPLPIDRKVIEGIQAADPRPA